MESDFLSLALARRTSASMDPLWKRCGALSMKWPMVAALTLTAAPLARRYALSSWRKPAGSSPPEQRSMFPSPPHNWDGQNRILAIGGGLVAWRCAVPLDGNDEVVRPAIIWCDQRTEPQVQELSDLFGANQLVHLTCNAPLTNSACCRSCASRRGSRLWRCNPGGSRGRQLALCRRGLRCDRSNRQDS
jgi:hypothetical protein